MLKCVKQIVIFVPMAKGVKASPSKEVTKYIRTSFNIHPDTMAKIRYIGFFDKKDLTELIAEGLEVVISRYEKKHGPVPKK